MSTTYWYSTNAISGSSCNSINEAFERQTRVQIFDQEAFGNHPAIASPHLGTMTSGEIHYGLYRQPSLWETSDNSLDNLILIPGVGDIINMPTDSYEMANSNSATGLNNNNNNSNNSKSNHHSSSPLRRRPLRPHPNDLCCIIC
ncbi:unnamed protein product [Cunninghamella blakesleeana]